MQEKGPLLLKKFCESMKPAIKEEDFYQEFKSVHFHAVDRAIWKDSVVDTISDTKKTDNYDTYGAREKLLLFYFQLIENLNENRSFFFYLNESDNKIYC